MPKWVDIFLKINHKNKDSSNILYKSDYKKSYVIDTTIEDEVERIWIMTPEANGKRKDTFEKKN